MKKVIVFALTLLVIGCTPLKPTPFTTKGNAGVPEGCIQLRKDVEEYNKTHVIKRLPADC